MNKNFNPGDSVVVIFEEEKFIGIVSILELENTDSGTIIIDVEINDDDRTVWALHIDFIYHACIKCYGKGEIDLGSDIFVSCDCCNGSGIENNG